VALYLSVWPATWQAEVMVAVDAETDQQRAAFYTGWNTFRREGLNDEGTLMIAPPMLREVQAKLNLRYEDMWHPFTSYATHLWGESWVGQNYRKVKAFVLGRPKCSSTTRRCKTSLPASTSCRSVIPTSAFWW
jgi:hypothetical protein